jgi:hypothetical protein
MNSVEMQIGSALLMSVSKRHEASHKVYLMVGHSLVLHCTVVVASTTSLGSVRCTGYYMESMETITAASVVMLIIVANTVWH